MKTVLKVSFKDKKVDKHVGKADEDFIAKHGDLRPSLANHEQHGQQYFDSADWSMYKDDAEKGRQLRQLPRVNTEKHMKPRIIRKSMFSKRDSARSLTQSPLSTHASTEFQTQ